MSQGVVFKQRFEIIAERVREKIGQLYGNGAEKQAYNREHAKESLYRYLLTRQYQSRSK